MDFDEFFAGPWMKHIEDSGGIRAQLKLLTWLVGALITSNVALVSFLVIQNN